MGDSDCSETETVADEGVPPTVSPAPLQPPPPKTPPTNGAGFKSLVGVTEVKVKAAAEVKQAPAVGTPKRHYRPLECARETQTEVFRQMRAVQPQVHRLGMVTGGMGGRKNGDL